MHINWSRDWALKILMSKERKGTCYRKSSSLYTRISALFSICNFQVTGRVTSPCPCPFVWALLPNDVGPGDISAVEVTSQTRFQIRTSISGGQGLCDLAAWIYLIVFNFLFCMWSRLYWNISKNILKSILVWDFWRRDSIVWWLSDYASGRRGLEYSLFFFFLQLWYLILLLCKVELQE